MDLQRVVCARADLSIQAVKNLFPVSAIANNSLDPKQPQMVTDGRLWQLQFLAQAAYIAFPFGQQHEDFQPGFIGKEFEQARQGLEVLVVNPGSML
jgi:hypothetical protein